MIALRFPYDEQHCDLKFGSWTYGGYELDMAHLDSDAIHVANTSDGIEWRVELGVDLSEFQESVEFDLLSAVGIRHDKRYPCCDYPAIDITYYLNVRRKKLFYTINLMTPCAGLAALIPVVFYLPSESHNKVMLCVSILVSLTVFFLVLIDTIPPTSIATPFIAKYLVFVMFMVTMSVFFTVIVLNLHNRQDQKQSPILRLLVKLLGKYFSPGHLSKAPPKQIDTLNALSLLESHFEQGYETGTKKSLLYFYGPTPCLRPIEPLEKVASTLRNLRFISHVFKEKEALEKHRTDWKHAAMVIDRFMLVFFTAFILGVTLVTTLSAPSLRDNRAPLTTTANLLDEWVLPGNVSD
ncbi:CRE-ACR-6 protein [Aphelenchoides avenae]|nr:CRE-ACR-6 protein [Aphelenchus avenae]